MLFLLVVLAGVRALIGSRVAARWRSRLFMALAAARGASFGRAWGETEPPGFLPTVISVFGAHGELVSVVSGEADAGRYYLFEYLFSHRPLRWFRYRQVAVGVAVRLRGCTLPTLTLRRPPGMPISGETEFEINGERLWVQVIGGELELWCARGERRRARTLASPALVEAMRAHPGWDVRGVESWLVMFKRGGGCARDAVSLAASLDEALMLARLVASPCRGAGGRG